MSRFVLIMVLLCLVLPASATARTPAPAGLPGNGEIFKTIADLTSHGPRRMGLPGLDFAVDYVEQQLQDSGLTGVHVEETPTYSWEFSEPSLKVGNDAISAFPIAYSMSPGPTAVGDFSTPPGGLKAPIVDAGLGLGVGQLGQDVKGKIVMFDLKFLLPLAGLTPFMEFLWDPLQTLATDPVSLLVANPYITTYQESISAAIDNGAAGVIGVLADYFDSNRYYNELYRRLNVSVPGMWVTKAEGAHIRQLLAKDAQAPATVQLKVQRRQVPSHVVVGYLEGKSKDTIMVTSHHDSVLTGAVEDASGTAEVLALAKYYGRQPAQSREKSLMFVTFDSHFSGYHAHQAFVKRHITERTDPHRPVADVTIEHIAKFAKTQPDGTLNVTNLPEARGIFESFGPLLKADLISGVVRNDLRRTAVLNGTTFQPIGIPTDASFALLSGIPIASYISGPIYLYDEQDTLDKIAVDQLQPVAQTFQELIDQIDTTPSALIGLVPGVSGATAKPGTPPASVDRVRVPPATCTAATTGTPVKDVKLRLAARGAILTFTTRRALTLTVTVRHRSGRAARLTKFSTVRACRRYTVRLPRTVVRVRLRGGGRSVTVRRAEARRAAARS